MVKSCIFRITRTIADSNFNKQDFLPVTSNLLKVKDYCLSRTETLIVDLQKSVDKQHWRELAEVVITRLTIFNKRRGKEVSSILLKRYQDRADYGKALHDDVLESLSPLEKKLMERYFLTFSSAIGLTGKGLGYKKFCDFYGF